MCDTRTWVFKLLIVFFIIHFSRIQRCHGVSAAASSSSLGMDAAIAMEVAKGPSIDTADVSIDDDDVDDDNDSFEGAATPSPEDLLSGSQRTNFNSSTYISRQQQQLNKDSLSSLSSSANRLPSEDDDADDDDGSNEEFITNQRKFNNEEAAQRQKKIQQTPQHQKQRKDPTTGEEESSKRSSILNILQGDDYIGDSIITASSSWPQSSSVSTPKPPPPPPSIGWNTNTNPNTNKSKVGNTVGSDFDNDDDDDNDGDDEDVDEILQPMVMASDKHHYHSNNGGRVLQNSGPPVGDSISSSSSSSSTFSGYPIEFNPNRNEDSSGSNNNLVKEETPLTNRAKLGNYVSAFEQHKAIIRNNRRYGHKSHKKKYKDYLRYNPITTSTTPSPFLTTTTKSALRKGILARDRIFHSDDSPARGYYVGQVNFYEDGDNRKDQNFRSYHNPSARQHHTNTHHLRSGGRYRHVTDTSKSNRPHYSDFNGISNQHLGSRAMQKHQKELEKKIEEYSQYYAKWPHLAQVEDQLFEDEHTDMLYPEEGGSSPGELVLSSADEEEENARREQAKKQQEEENLPPYIKKYRRRNKQLMDLLEGTKPPPSTIAPQWSSSVLKPGPIDGSYQNHHHQHRKHHNHNRQHRNHQRSHRHKNSKWQIEDLFEEQRANPNNPNKTEAYSDVMKPTPSVVDTSSPSTTTTTTTTSTTTLSPFDELLKHENEHLKLLQENKLPAEDISISRELYDWAIDTSNDQEDFNDENINDDNDDYFNRNRQSHRWKSSNRNASPVKYPTTTTRRPVVSSIRRPNAVYGNIIRSPPTTTPKPINTFVYHRVVESPRAVGAGQTGRKQRLPFVAITDRRLETSRKGMGNAGVLAHKDFEQNHFPMP